MSKQDSSLVETLNHLGVIHWNFAATMFVQVGLLVLIIASLNWLLNRRMSANVRYCIWSLVLFKLMLPVSLQGPLSLTGLLDGLPQQHRSIKAANGPIAASEREEISLEPKFECERAKRALTEGERSSQTLRMSPTTVISETESDPPASIRVQKLPDSLLTVAENSQAKPDAAIPLHASSQPTSASRSIIQWQAWLLIVWMGIVIFLLGLFVRRVFQVRHLVHTSSVAPLAFIHLLRECQKLFELGHWTIQLRLSDQIGSPAICGIWRTTILFPSAHVGKLDDEQLRLIFVHELLHWKRFDLAMNCLQSLLQIVYFYNPLVWITNHCIRRLREQAVDDAVLATMQTSAERYSVTLLDIVALPRATSPVSLSLVGMIGARGAISQRIQRILKQRVPGQARLGISGIATVVVAGLLLLPLAGRGKSDDKQLPKPQAVNDFSITGTCLDHDTKTPIEGVSVRLYAHVGISRDVEGVAETTSDREGKFRFRNLVAPREDGYFDKREYCLVAKLKNKAVCLTQVSSQKSDVEYFASIAVDESGSTTAIPFALQKESKDSTDYTISLRGNPVTIRGRVVDQKGNAVPNATVERWVCEVRIPGVHSAVTDQDGRFTITGLPPDNLEADETSDEKDADDGTTEYSIGGIKFSSLKNVFMVFHSRYPITSVEADPELGDIELKIASGCVLSGTAIDAASGATMSGVAITALSTDDGSRNSPIMTDETGRFRLSVLPGEYQVRAEFPDRVAFALTNLECPVDGTIELPPFQMIGGGFIAGQVVNSETGKPVVFSEESGFRIKISLSGPSQPPANRSFIRGEFAEVDDDGRFRLRAAPGENFPYIVNDGRGERMVATTRRHNAVIVKPGEAANTIMRIMPKATPAEAMGEGNRIIAALPTVPAERVSQIVHEIHTRNVPFEENLLGEMDTAAQLIRELVTIGRDGVSTLCHELDQSDDEMTLDCLAFALRAIGDIRAVPALIRAIPRTLQPKSFRCGTRVKDPELQEFMQRHSKGSGQYQGLEFFMFGHPFAEVTSALEGMTGQRNADEDGPIGSINASDDPKRLAVQRRLFRKEAEKWRDWWEAHWQELTEDQSLAKVNLPIEHDDSISSLLIGRAAKLNGGTAREFLSPVDPDAEDRQYFFYDIDTGLHPKWPEQIPQNEESVWKGDLSAWAAENGVDLMCVKYQPRDGEPTYTLRAFNMRVWEISEHDADTIGKTIKRGSLPAGGPVGDLLMHFDGATAQYVPDASAAFLFSTREGSIGLLRIIDRITQAANLRNVPEKEIPKGVGSALGVKFQIKFITAN